MGDFKKEESFLGKGGSIGGSLHRVAAKAAYEEALQSLPADVRALVERQYQGVKANHDRVRNLRNAAA